MKEVGRQKYAVTNWAVLPQQQAAFGSVHVVVDATFYEILPTNKKKSTSKSQKQTLPAKRYRVSSNERSSYSYHRVHITTCRLNIYPCSHWPNSNKTHCIFEFALILTLKSRSFPVYSALAGWYAHTGQASVHGIGTVNEWIMSWMKINLTLDHPPGRACIRREEKETWAFYQCDWLIIEFYLFFLFIFYFFSFAKCSRVTKCSRWSTWKTLGCPFNARTHDADVGTRV